MLEPTIFFVLSSDGVGEYQVSVRLDGDRVICSCDCPAGRYGKICKHKISILSGSGENLVHKSQLDQLQSLSAGLADKNIGLCLQELGDAEAAQAHAKKNLDSVKRKLERLICE